MSERMPFDFLGGEAPVRALSTAFYDAMDLHEPALAKLHGLDERGLVARHHRDNFASFLIEWLGGPRDYSRDHGHPRLRMRHGRVPIDTAMRDAWVRCMQIALDGQGVTGEVRTFLDRRFTEVAEFLRNVPE